MRNHWFHNHQAEYLSTCTDINPKTVSAERDFLFGLSEAEAQASKYKKADVNNTPLKPQIKRIAVSGPQFSAYLTDRFRSFLDLMHISFPPTDLFVPIATGEIGTPRVVPAASLYFL